MAATALDIARLVLRDGAEADAPVACAGSNDYDGRMGARISSAFVILVASTFGEYITTTLITMH